MKTVMKKTSIYMAILLAVLVPSLSFAQNAAVFGTKDEVKAGETATTPAEIKDSPLSAKKLYVETQLKNLLSQLGTISTRTQAAIDRLSDKNIDTTAAQAQLDKAGVALTNAKISIDAFSAIQVIDTTDKAKTAALTASLKEAVKKAEDNLKISRDALIQSLSLLKVSINASISSDTE